MPDEISTSIDLIPINITQPIKPFRVGVRYRQFWSGTIGCDCGTKMEQKLALTHTNEILSIERSYRFKHLIMIY